ncbi:trypsin-like peptidase domain-containing protein [Streptomyces sp900105755]|uniref:Trypsin-like peptidase domain-containing protein n=1 Tax=Streptomyces sp. 900105755 TaxID=3154389 RepID=A0ABV1TWN9_9ACTN
MDVVPAFSWHGNGQGPGLTIAVVQVLEAADRVVGAGFLASEGVVITCAHVVAKAGAGPGSTIRLAFPHVEGRPEARGLVVAEAWRSPEDEDIAFVRLDETPAGVTPLALGSADGCRGHRVRTFGFPGQAPPDGHFGYGIAGDLIPAQGRSLLQLTDANDLTAGFSGAPITDDVTGLVIGMLSAITAPDTFLKGQGIAYATPSEALREIWPALAEREVRPYRGLEPFTAAHAEWFHGRDEAVDRVLAGLAEHLQALMLLGPSGSGKSSLIQAGVLPALAAGRLPGSDRWLPVLVRPGHDLSAELEHAGLAGASADGILAGVTRALDADPTCERIVLIIDQFEELLIRPDGERQSPNDGHLDVLDQLSAVIGSGSRVSVILVMRDDFYPLLASTAPELLEAAAPGLVNVPATLGVQDLKEIITLPAEVAGARFENGLPERIIADVLAGDRTGPTARRAPVTLLPALELVLSQLWERRRSGFLTHEAYDAVGEVTGSLATWCNAVLDRLPMGQRPIAKRILTALVRPAIGSHLVPAVRQQLPLSVLRELAADTGADDPSAGSGVDEVVASLTRYRIITTRSERSPGHAESAPGRPVAELIHDTLIRDWPELRAWVAEDHGFHDWLRRAGERQARWAEIPGSGDLLAGRDLAEGLEFSQQRALPKDIAAFLRRSHRHQQAAIRRSRRLNSLLASALVLALVAAGSFLWQRQTAVTAQRVAESRQLAAQSAGLIDTNPDLASLLAIRAYQRSHTTEALASLYAAAALPLQHRLVASKGEVSAVAFSSDRRTLATGSGRTVRLWNVTDGRARASLTGATDSVFSLAFSPDGRTVAAGMADGTARLWDVATGQSRVLIGDRTGNAVEAIAFSPGGGVLATGSKNGAVQLWDARSGHLRTTLAGHIGPVDTLAFNPRGGTLATGGGDKTVRLWDLDGHKTLRKLTGGAGIVASVAFSPDGNTLATASGNRVRLWAAATGDARATLTGHTARVMSVAFSPDGTTLATAGADKTARLWNAANHQTQAVLTGHSGMVTSVAFSPDGRHLATGSTDHTARLWGLPNNSVRHLLNGHKDSVLSVAFSPDGRTLATGSDQVRLWDVTTGRRLGTTFPSDAESVAFTPDGHTLASAAFLESARLWDVTTGHVRAKLTGRASEAISVAFSPDGRTLATGSDDGTTGLWNVSTLRTRVILPARPRSAVASVAFARDGRTLATGNSDGTTQLWDTASGRQELTLPGHARVNSVAFSPDGNTLATGDDDGTTCLWDVATGRALARFTGTSTIESVAFSRGGHTLATGSDDGAVRLRDLETGQVRSTLTGHNGAVDSVAFSPDGDTLATGSDDHTARLWAVSLPDPSEAVRMICRAVHRDLTSQEQSEYLSAQSHSPICPGS